MAALVPGRAPPPRTGAGARDAAAAPRPRALVRRAVHRRGGPPAARRDPVGDPGRRRGHQLPRGRPAVVQRALLRRRPRLDVPARPGRRHVAPGALPPGDRRRPGARDPRRGPAERDGDRRPHRAAARGRPPAAPAVGRGPQLRADRAGDRSGGARPGALAAGAAPGPAALRARRRGDGPGPLVRGHRAGRVRRRRGGPARTPGAPGGRRGRRRCAARLSARRGEPAQRHRCAQRRAPAGHRRPAARLRRRGLGRRGIPLLWLAVGLAVRAARCGGRGACGWSGWRGCCVPLLLLLGRRAAAAGVPPPLPARRPARARRAGRRGGPGRAARRPRPGGGAAAGCALLSSAPLLEREPAGAGRRPRRTLAAVQVAGEPVVAADQRSAIGLDHYVRPGAAAARRPGPARRTTRRPTPTGSGWSGG